jgi:predicted RNA methylase
VDNHKNGACAKAGDSRSCPHPSTPSAAPIHSPRSLRHEYELFVEREIEDYKDSVSRNALLKIGDEAVAALTASDQIALTELLVWQEVDRIITKRLRLPSYPTWRRRRLKMLEEYRKPEHWGLEPDAALVRMLADPLEAHVLVAGAAQEGAALYLAARGAAVTAVEPAVDAVERVVRAAEAAGLTERVRGYCADLGAWSPDVALHAVVCTPAAFEGLDADDRARVIEILQSATVDGGVHLVETIAAGHDARSTLRIEELATRYHGWTISVERSAGARETFMARKAAAVA